MNDARMPREYLGLARKRAETRWPGYRQPEDFGYDFREWVSPYTKGAHALGGIALVLQDWSSADTLSGLVDPSIQEHGRTINLLTNRRLEELLSRLFGLSLADVYATNVFPFVKDGGISSSVPRRRVAAAAHEFARVELSIAQPKVVIALGKMASIGLAEIGVECVSLPHPAARIGSTDRHEAIWRATLGRATSKELVMKCLAPSPQ